MSRRILGTMEEIFDNLKDFVQGDDRSRIVEADRHIWPTGRADLVREFVRAAAAKPVLCGAESLCLFEFKGQRYLLLDKRFEDALLEIGLDLEADEAVLQGAGMLAMANGSLSIRQGVTSLQVIDECLGVEPEQRGKKDVILEFAQIKSLFTPYCVAKLDDSRFQLIYAEDFDRLICYLLIEEKGVFAESSNAGIKSLLLLLSSRSIAGSILNGLRSSSAEYRFLQIYQCIEYLFRLNSCFIVSEAHDISLKKSIEIVLAHEFKLSEAEHLYQVLSGNASGSAIQGFLKIMPGNPGHGTDNCKTASNYIYKLRCNIAHLRYRQDGVSTVDWEAYITALIEILCSIYQKLDAKIIQVCISNGAWNPIGI